MGGKALDFHLTPPPVGGDGDKGKWWAAPAISAGCELRRLEAIAKPDFTVILNRI
jgi:hypothetical protein